MFSRVHFVRPSRPFLSRVFYVTLTAEQAFALNGSINSLRLVQITLHCVCVFFSLQAESVEKVGIADAYARYPFFALKEDKEPASEKADVEEGAATEDGAAVVAIEISIRGVCTLWHRWLQCDMMNRYRLRGSLYNRLIGCYGDILYQCV